jgi:chromate transporter
LFWGFSMLSLQGFGGVMAVTQRELIDRRRWMPREEFLEDWAVAQVLPGPNVANLGVIIGDRHFGTRGALVCLLGLFLFPLIIVSVLAMAFTTFEHLPVIQGALKGMGLVVVALILTTALKLASALRTHVGGALFCVLASVSTFLAIAVFRFPLAWVLLVVGSLSCAWTYYRIVRSVAVPRRAP